jgi:biotin carboxylase
VGSSPLWADEIGKAYVAGKTLKGEIAEMQKFIGQLVIDYHKSKEAITALLEYTPYPYVKMDAEWGPCE